MYLKEYYELHGVFELIDAGSVQRICSMTAARLAEPLAARLAEPAAL